ncbi:hypothetical protein Syun_012932 [Stephania yunnanensis]|uniref:Uncharacterized protein n=1 Tax=Stephania yunnanensis TaxID=152371 RepID=A0AAP0K0E2_9MAGN
MGQAKRSGEQRVRRQWSIGWCRVGKTMEKRVVTMEERRVVAMKERRRVVAWRRKEGEGVEVEFGGFEGLGLVMKWEDD